MAGEDGSHFSFCGLGSFLPTRKRISGFCLLCIICFLCLQHVRFHPLTRTTRCDRASCSRAGIVLAAALGSDGKAKETQTRSTGGQKSIIRTSQRHQEPPLGGSTGTTIAMRSNRAASAGRPSDDGSNWTTAGWTPLESPATTFSGVTETSLSVTEGDQRRTERNGSSDRPTTTDSPDVSDNRQQFFAGPDTQKENATKESGGMFGSTFRARRGRLRKRKRLSAVSRVSPGRDDGSSSSEQDGGEEQHKEADQGHEADEEEGHDKEKEGGDASRGDSGEGDGGGGEDRASGTTERKEEQEEETPSTSGAPEFKKRSQMRRSQVRVRLDQISDSEGEEPNSGSEKQNGNADVALRALRPLTRRFSSLVDQGTAGFSSDGMVRTPSDTVQLVYATMEAMREAQLTWAKSSARGGRLKRVNRQRKSLEQSTSQMVGPIDYPLARPSLTEWDSRRSPRKVVASPREEQEQREEEKESQEPEDGAERADIFATAEQPAQHLQQEKPESQGLSMTSHRSGIKKNVSDGGDYAGTLEKGKKRRYKRRRYVEKEKDTELHTHSSLLSIPGLSVPPRHLILTSTSNVTGNADAQSEEESKQSEEEKVFLQRGMDKEAQADCVTPEQPPSSEVKAIATTFERTAEGRQKKQKKRLGLSKSASDGAMALAKKSCLSEDLQASQTGTSPTEEMADLKKAQPMEPQPTKEESTQSLEVAQEQKKRKHKRQLKRSPEQKEKKNRRTKVDKQSPGTTTGGPIGGPSASAARFGSSSGTQKAKRKTSPSSSGTQKAKRKTSPSSSGTQKAKRKTSPGDLQRKRRQSTSAKAPGQSSAGAGQSTLSSKGAGPPSATQKKKKEKKSVPQKEGNTSAQKEKSKKKPPRAATDPGFWRRSAFRDWKKLVKQYPRTFEGLLKRTKAVSNPERIAHAVAVLERQHSRRGPQSRLLDILQKRLTGRRRHDQRLGQLVDATRRHFGRRWTSSPPAAQLMLREQQQQPSSTGQPQQPSDMSPSLPLAMPILIPHSTFQPSATATPQDNGSGKGQAAAKAADSALCASRPSRSAQPRRAEEPFTSQVCQPGIADWAAASASTVLGASSEPVMSSVLQPPPQQQEAQSDVEGGEQQQQQLNAEFGVEGRNEQPQEEQQMRLSPQEEADVETAIMDTMLEDNESTSPVLSNDFLRYLVSPIEEEDGYWSSSSARSLETSREDVAGLMATTVPSQPSAVSGERSGVSHQAPCTSSDYMTHSSQAGSNGQAGPAFAAESSHGEQSQPQPAVGKLAAYPATSLPRASSSTTPFSSQFEGAATKREMVSQMVALPAQQQVQLSDVALDLSLGGRGVAQSQLQSQRAADDREDVSERSTSAQAQESPQSASSVSLQPSATPETSLRTPASSFSRPHRISHSHMRSHQLSHMEATSSSGPRSVPPRAISPSSVSLSRSSSLPRLQSPISSPRISHHVPHAQSAPPSPRMQPTSLGVRPLLYRMLLLKGAANYRADQQARQQAVHDTPTTSTESRETQSGTSASADATHALPRSTSSVQQGPATSSTSIPSYLLPHSLSPSSSTDLGVYSSPAQRYSPHFSSRQQSSTAGQPFSPYDRSVPESSPAARTFTHHVSSESDISMRAHPHERFEAESSAPSPVGETFAPFPYVATPYQSFRGSQADDEDSSVEEPSSSTGHAPARRLRGQEKEEEQKGKSSDKEKVKRMQLENKVIEAGISVLRLLSADFRKSPLATVETSPEEEVTLNRVDDGLNEREMLLKNIACFRTVERHFTARRAKYISVVDREALNLGMRDDEVLRLLFHAMWVTCYFNVKAEQLQQLVDGRLNEEEELLLLQRTSETPTRFSRKQHSVTEEVIRRFAREYLAEDAKVNGTLGIMYSALIVTGLFVCLLILHRFYRSRRYRGGKNGKQKILDTTQNSHVELSHCVKQPGCTPASKNDTCVF